MSDQYELRTIADFIAVPEDRLAECLTDFATWLSLARQTNAFNAAAKNLLGEGVSFGLDSDLDAKE